jgi:hypothetical protein
MRFWALAACLAACASNDDPRLRVTVDPTNSSNVWLTVLRAPGHTFHHVVATINGVDAGASSIGSGFERGWNSPVGEADSPAMATFALTSEQIGSSLHAEVNDDGDRYVLDVPDFGSARTPTVVTPLDQPLHPNDLVEVATGIASDRIGDGMLGQLDGVDCFVQWGTEIGAGSTKFKLPPDFSTTWECGAAPAPGATLAIQLMLDLEVWPAITTCTGPSLTCDPPDLHLPRVLVPALIQA